MMQSLLYINEQYIIQANIPSHRFLKIPSSRFNLIKMNVFKNGNIRIDYNSFMNRLSIMNATDWVSINQTVFNIFCSLIGTKSQYDRVTIIENTGNVEIVQLFGNFLISYTTKIFSSSVSFKDFEVMQIRDSISMINESIVSMQTNKKNRISKRVTSKTIASNNKRRLNQEIEIMFDDSIKNTSGKFYMIFSLHVFQTVIFFSDNNFFSFR